MSKEIALKVGLVFYFHNISQIPPYLAYSSVSFFVLLM